VSVFLSEAIDRICQTREEHIACSEELLRRLPVDDQSSIVQKIVAVVQQRIHRSPSMAETRTMAGKRKITRITSTGSNDGSPKDFSSTTTKHVSLISGSRINETENQNGSPSTPGGGHEDTLQDLPITLDSVSGCGRPILDGHRRAAVGHQDEFVVLAPDALDETLHVPKKLRLPRRVREFVVKLSTDKVANSPSTSTGSNVIDKPTERLLKQIILFYAYVSNLQAIAINNRSTAGWKSTANSYSVSIDGENDEVSESLYKYFLARFGAFAQLADNKMIGLLRNVKMQYANHPRIRLFHMFITRELPRECFFHYLDAMEHVAKLGLNVGKTRNSSFR
jgi:hypothetical protein